MPYELPEKLKTIQPYDPVTESFAVRSDANESYENLPEEILNEILEQFRTVEFNRYPDPSAKVLRETAAKLYGVDPSNLSVGCGSDELLGLIANGFLAPGETMVVAMPDFSMYAFYAHMAGAKVVDAMAYAGKKGPDALNMTSDDLIRCAKETNARMLVFSNPCNPTSLLLRKEEVRRILEELPNCLIVSDEAYMEFSLHEDGTEPEGAVGDAATMIQEMIASDHGMVLKTCSKAYGCAAIRLGFAIAGEKIAGLMNAMKSPYNVNTLTQIAGTVLLSHPEYLADCGKKLRASRDELYAGLTSLKNTKKQIIRVEKPQTNFVFFEAENAPDVFLKLREHGISIRNMNPYLRISAGSPEENRRILTALEEILN